MRRYVPFDATQPTKALIAAKDGANEVSVSFQAGPLSP